MLAPAVTLAVGAVALAVAAVAAVVGNRHHRRSSLRLDCRGALLNDEMTVTLEAGSDGTPSCCCCCCCCLLPLLPQPQHLFRHHQAYLCRWDFWRDGVLDLCAGF